MINKKNQRKNGKRNLAPRVWQCAIEHFEIKIFISEKAAMLTDAKPPNVFDRNLSCRVFVLGEYYGATYNNTMPIILNDSIQFFGVIFFVHTSTLYWHV